MGQGQRKFKTLREAQKRRRKGEIVVAYEGGFQIRRKKK